MVSKACLIKQLIRSKERSKTVQKQQRQNLIEAPPPLPPVREAAEVADQAEATKVIAVVAAKAVVLVAVAAAEALETKKPTLW